MTVVNIGRVQGSGMWTAAKLLSLESLRNQMLGWMVLATDSSCVLSAAARLAEEMDAIHLPLQCPQSGLLRHAALANTCLCTRKSLKPAQQHRPRNSADHIAPWDCPQRVHLLRLSTTRFHPENSPGLKVTIPSTSQAKLGEMVLDPRRPAWHNTTSMTVLLCSVQRSSDCSELSATHTGQQDPTYYAGPDKPPIQKKKN